MLSRTLAVWLVLLGIAVLNGTARELVLVPRLGEYPRHVISCLVLSAMIARASIGWIGPATDPSRTPLDPRGRRDTLGAGVGVFTARAEVVAVPSSAEKPARS